MLGNLDPVKILIVLLVGAMLLGPERLPKAARQLGNAWRELTKLRERLEQEVRSALPDVDLPKIPNVPGLKRGAVSGYINNMMQPGAAGEAGAVSASATGPSLAGATVVGQDAADFGGASGVSTRPGWQPATNIEGGRAPLAQSDWVTSAAFADEQADVPAGWHTGSEIPGYASGARLATVPSSAGRGPMRVEAALSFDEPGWN